MEWNMDFKSLPREERQQKIVDRVWWWFIIEGNDFGRDSYTGSCQYIDPDRGNRCAVGCLLTEETAIAWTKGEVGGITSKWSAFTPTHVRVFFDESFHPADQQLLSTLQDLHDEAANAVDPDLAANAVDPDLAAFQAKLEDFIDEAGLAVRSSDPAQFLAQVRESAWFKMENGDEATAST